MPYITCFEPGVSSSGNCCIYRNGIVYCTWISISSLGGERPLILMHVDCVWNVMAHAQKPDFFFRRNGWVQLNRWGRQFSRLLAAEVCATAVVMLDTPCSEVVWRVLATYSIRQFPLHFPSRASPCAITFQLDSTTHYTIPVYSTIFLKMNPAVRNM